MTESLPGENHYYDCWQVTDKEKSEALLTYVQVLARANVKSRRIRFKNLISEAQYVLEETGKVYSGEMLMQAGILIPPLKGDYWSRLYHVVRL